MSYNHKHNAANGEANRDGSDDNLSWNSWGRGADGRPRSQQAPALRRAKGMMATLMLSQGVPMILAGDEFLRTQRGNNNAWCQDGELSWVDWTLAEVNAEFLTFTKGMIALRKAHPVFRRRRFFDGTLGPAPAVTPPPSGVVPAMLFPPGGPVRPGDAGLPDAADPADPPPEPYGVRTPAARKATAPLSDIHWHGTQPFKPDFGPTSRHLAYSLDGRFTGRDGDPDYRADRDFYVAVNVGPAPLKFTVPASPTGRRWRRVVNTAAPPPEDVRAGEPGPPVAPLSPVTVEPFGLVVLMTEE